MNEIKPKYERQEAAYNEEARKAPVQNWSYMIDVEQRRYLKEQGDHGRYLFELLEMPGLGEDAIRIYSLIALAPVMFEALQLIAAKIDKASGAPTFTAEEHGALELLIKQAKGERTP